MPTPPAEDRPAIEPRPHAEAGRLRRPRRAWSDRVSRSRPPGARRRSPRRSRSWPARASRSPSARPGSCRLELERRARDRGRRARRSGRAHERESRSSSSTAPRHPHGLSLVDGENPRRAAHRGRRGARARVPALVRPLGRVRPRRRSAFSRTTASAPSATSAASTSSSRSRSTRDPRSSRTSCSPRETQVFTGNRLRARKAEGIEFADLRPFVPGDRVRRINWRASARRGELWVNELHAERNADVILFLDSFTEARREDESTLDRAVRARSRARRSTTSSTRTASASSASAACSTGCCPRRE